MEPLPGLKLHPGDDDKDRKTHPEAKHDGNETNNVEGVGNGNGLSRSSSSSSSSSSSNGKAVHVDNDGYLSPEPDCPQWSMVSASPRGSGILSSSGADGFSRTPEWVAASSNLSPMKSPPLQAMGRGYDPNRIPSSVFSNKPSTPMDWSVASNESLFSIHMGNNSFSRDAAFLDGNDESGGNFTPNLAPVAETSLRGNDGKTNVYVRPGLEEDLETPKMARHEADEVKEKMANNANGVLLSNSSNLSDGGKGAPRVSNESTKSTESIAFPVLVGDGAKGGNSIKPAAEKPKTPEAQPPKEEAKPETKEPQATTPAPASWFSCFNCWPPSARCC